MEKEWTFSGNICIDPPWDDTEDLVNITRDTESKRGQGKASCYSIPVCTMGNIAPGAFNFQLQTKQSTALFTVRGNKDSCARISPNCQTWNSLWELGMLACWQPGFLSCSVLGLVACLAPKNLRKPQRTNSMTQIILKTILYGLQCSSEVSSGGTTRAPVLPGRFPHCQGPCLRD